MSTSTLLDLEKSVLNLISEVYASTVGDLPTGSGGAATLATIITSGSGAAVVKTLLNEGIADLARTCVPVPEVGTITWGSSAQTITGATNATPIVVTVAGHGYVVGDVVYITGGLGNTAMNGRWFVSAVTTNTFTLLGSVGNGAWTSGGTVTKLTRTQLLSGFTPGTSGQQIWAVRGVAFGTSSIPYSDRAAIEIHDSSWTTTAATTPTDWFNDGPLSIGLYPTPLTQGIVTVYGYAIPPALSATSDTLAWLTEDLTKLLCYYAASKLCLMRLEDPSLTPRIEAWMSLYHAGRMDLWLKIDPRIRRAHFPTPPLAKA